jgi:hypothetical protein
MGILTRGMIAVIGISIIMVFATLISGAKKLKSGMPIAASCSAAISDLYSK